MPNRAHLTGRRLIIAGAALCAAAVAAAALNYLGTEFVAGRFHQPPAAVAPPPSNLGTAAAETLGFIFHDQPRALPELRFADGEGHDLSLRDFRGRPVLLNIWATWCVPCRREMPALDRLQAALGKAQLLVLPLSIDRQGVSAVQPFYQGLGLKTLGIYVDPSGTATGALNAVGVPTTLLIDSDGREIGRKLGPAEWDSPEMLSTILEHLGLPAPQQKASP